MYVESYLQPPATNEGLLVPRSAVLWTGKESVVYLRSSSPNERDFFSFRVVKLGKQFGNYYHVHSGLEEGAEVVTEGALAIDATMQLEGKTHMMSPRSTTNSTDMMSFKSTTNSIPSAPDSTLNTQLEAYFSLTEALIDSDEATAQQAATTFATALQKSTSNPSYTELNKQLLPLLKQMKSSSLEEIRALYAEASNLWIEYLPKLGSTTNTLYEVYCPMSLNNQGARWLWKKKEVLNPYFGSSMLKCGRVVGPVKAP